MFILPGFFTIFFSLGTILNILILINDVEREINLYRRMREADFKMRHCARVKVSFKNIGDAFSYLSKKIKDKDKIKNLLKAKIKLESKILPYFSYKPCFHKEIKGLMARPHKQYNPQLSVFWPNWVVAYYYQEREV